MIKKILEKSKWFILVPVIASLLSAISVFIWGAIRMGANIWHLIEGVVTGHMDLSATGVHMIEVVDTFLLAVVLYIVAVGFYELFFEELDLPGWLVFHNLHDLKEKLVSVIIMVMAVTFLEHMVTWQDGTETLKFAAAIALMIVALIIYSRLGDAPHKEKEKD